MPFSGRHAIHLVRWSVLLSAVLLSSGHAAVTTQSSRTRVRVDAVGADPVGVAFAASLRDAVAKSEKLTLSTDGRGFDITMMVVSVRAECNELPTSAIAVAAHWPGRVRSSQWANVVITDESHVAEYARRAVAEAVSVLGAAAQ
jgi:hypothetical protein